MNPSHGLSWEKSGEQEGVFATLFILTGKLVKYEDVTISGISVAHQQEWIKPIPISTSKKIVSYMCIETDNAWLPVSISRVDDMNKYIYGINNAGDTISGYIVSAK